MVTDARRGQDMRLWGRLTLRLNELALLVCGHAWSGSAAQLLIIELRLLLVDTVCGDWLPIRVQ